jgi:hypothetical protein
MSGFMQTLKVQRWDDHRYYHHSLVNQSLHLLSAISFIFMWFLLFWDPAYRGLGRMDGVDDQPPDWPFLL